MMHTAEERRRRAERDEERRRQRANAETFAEWAEGIFAANEADRQIAPPPTLAAPTHHNTEETNR